MIGTLVGLAIQRVLQEARAERPRSMAHTKLHVGGRRALDVFDGSELGLVHHPAELHVLRRR
jgi:hypothetical protein